MKVWIRSSSFKEFLQIPKVWEILINFSEYNFLKNWFIALIRWVLIWFFSLSSKGPRAKHFLERSEYIKLIAPNGAFGFWGPIRLVFEIHSCQTSMFKSVNWINIVTSLPYQNPKSILKYKNKSTTKKQKPTKQKHLWQLWEIVWGYHTQIENFEEVLKNRKQIGQN